MTTDLNALRQSAETLKKTVRDRGGFGVGNMHYVCVTDKEFDKLLAAMLPLIEELEACRKDAGRWREHVTVQRASRKDNALTIRLIKMSKGEIYQYERVILDEVVLPSMHHKVIGEESAHMYESLIAAIDADAVMKHTEPDGEKGEVR